MTTTKMTYQMSGYKSLPLLMAGETVKPKEGKTHVVLDAVRASTAAESRKRFDDAVLIAKKMPLEDRPIVTCGAIGLKMSAVGKSQSSCFDFYWFPKTNNTFLVKSDDHSFIMQQVEWSAAAHAAWKR